MLDCAAQPGLVVHALLAVVTGLPGRPVPVGGHVHVIPVSHSHLSIARNCIYHKVKLSTDLLILANVGYSGHAGDEPELGVVKHHELAIGGEAVITLVGQTAAVSSNVLKMARISGHYMSSKVTINLGPCGDVNCPPPACRQGQRF